MLVLSRKIGESILIGNGVTITVLDLRPSRIRLGIDAPLSLRIQRAECENPSAGRALVEAGPYEMKIS